MGEKTLFARKATGLVREVGFVTAVILAIANVVGLGWQKRVFQSIGAESVMPSEFFHGIHPMIMAFFLVGILMLLSIYTFMVLSAAMPRSGGGYVFMSRILNPGFAFVEAEELSLRRWKTIPGRVRPSDRMVAHTGFLIFARAVLPLDEETNDSE